METTIIIGGLVLLLLWVASKKGRESAKKEQAEEVLDAIKKAKKSRNSIGNKSKRDKLRAFFDRDNK